MAPASPLGVYQPQVMLSTEEFDRLEYGLGLDPRSGAARAAELEVSAAAAGDLSAQMRARLIQADAAERAGGLKAAINVMVEVNHWATAHDDKYLIARSHLLLSRAYRSMGDTAAHLDHLVVAVENLEYVVPAHRRVLYLVSYADALGGNGSLDLARQRYAQAAELARRSPEARDEILVLNNQAYTEYLAGELQRAGALVEEMRQVAVDRGHTLDSVDLDTIASVQISLGQYADAEQTLLGGIASYPQGRQESDALPEYYLRLTVARRMQGAITAAQASLDKCRALCLTHGHQEIMNRVLEEQAELHAVRKDWQLAFEQYKTFHAAERDRLSAQAAGQARIRQEMFELREAQREAEHFREQALRDPLTGLRNRRYVDEILPALIERSTQAGTSLWVAILDLDHFKRINDLCSHAIGDQVLTSVAALLSAAAGGLADPGGSVESFAARLGGEEFLFVFVAPEHADAVEILEQLRRSIAEWPWNTITGNLPVTASVGATAATPGTEPGALLARADVLLYEAKRAGRNRVAV